MADHVLVQAGELNVFEQYSIVTMTPEEEAVGEKPAHLCSYTNSPVTKSAMVFHSKKNHKESQRGGRGESHSSDLSMRSLISRRGDASPPGFCGEQKWCFARKNSSSEPRAAAAEGAECLACACALHECLKEPAARISGWLFCLCSQRTLEAVSTAQYFMFFSSNRDAKKQACFHV